MTSIDNPGGENKERTLEERKGNIVKQARNVWETIHQLRADVKTNIIGQKTNIGLLPLSDDTNILVEACGISIAVAEKWANSMLDVDADRIVENRRETSFKQYSDFIDGFPDQTPHEFGKRVETALKGKDDLIQFFDRITSINPLVGATVVLLYDQASRGELAHYLPGDTGSEAERAVFVPASEWYKKSVEQAAETSQYINAFFGKVIDKVITTTGQNSGLTQMFLGDVRDDLQLNIAEILSYASCSAIHLKKEDCAVFISPIPVTAPNTSEVKEKVLSLLGPEQHEDGREPIYRKYAGELFDRVASDLKKGKVYLPIFSSVIDIATFVSKYKDFWRQAVDGLGVKKPRLTQVVDGTNAQRIDLGNAASIFFRDTQGINTEGFSSQARISVQGRAAFRGFDIRIDKEKRGLSLDVGGLDFPQMFAYVKSIADLDTQADCVMGYSRLVNKGGGLKGHRSFYPSVMESAATYSDERDGLEKPLTIGNKMALVAAVGIADGSQMGIRNHNFFSYHTRENVAQNRDYFTNFPLIVKQLKDALSK
jgi:hypothetical protein